MARFWDLWTDQILKTGSLWELLSWVCIWFVHMDVCGQTEFISKYLVFSFFWQQTMTVPPLASPGSRPPLLALGSDPGAIPESRSEGKRRVRCEGEKAHCGHFRSRAPFCPCLCVCTTPPPGHWTGTWSESTGNARGSSCNWSQTGACGVTPKTFGTPPCLCSHPGDPNG